MPTALNHSALLTDLYQLTMMQAYFEYGMSEPAVFEFFVRRLPEDRRFLIAAGLEQLLEYLEDLRFSEQEIEWLRSSGRFEEAFVDYLAGVRFDGDVHALPEGSVCFENEPIVRITAPLPVAQLVESRLINILHFQSLIASKAVRCVLAAPGKLLVDFGMRRAHGGEAGIYAARAAYLAGFDGTATVSAGMLFDIPVYGTMAHSFIEAHDDELTAFEHFARACPASVVLLIDTYDTEAAARKVAALVPRLREHGIEVRGVRVDSGDLADHARRVRAILDAGGCDRVTIFASGSLDEYVLAAFTARDVPVDGYGIGTHLDTSADRPYLDCAYKLQEYAGVARRKQSEGKETWPGRKQIYRQFDDQGRCKGDILTTEADLAPGVPLLQPVMLGGSRLAPAEPLSTLRDRVRDNLGALPEELRRLEGPVAPYPVTVSAELEALARAVDARNRQP